jgi:hypothetical protein
MPAMAHLRQGREENRAPTPSCKKISDNSFNKLLTARVGFQESTETAGHCRHSGTLGEDGDRPEPKKVSHEGTNEAPKLYPSVS